MPERKYIFPIESFPLKVSHTSNWYRSYRRVIALDSNGGFLFQSVPLPGVQAGSPQTTYDGRYIMINHNVAESTGHFTVLDTEDLVDGQDLNYTYTQSNATNPFSPLGVYHNPAEGYYKGGELNTNDIFIWGFDTAGGATSAGTGGVFGFQLPIDGTPMQYNLLGEQPRNFQSTTRPEITNDGRSMYWALTRAEQRCWVGSAFPPKPNRFHLGRTTTASFERGKPVYIAARASPTLSKDPAQPTVWGPGAREEIWRMVSWT